MTTTEKSDAIVKWLIEMTKIGTCEWDWLTGPTGSLAGLMGRLYVGYPPKSVYVYALAQTVGIYVVSIDSCALWPSRNLYDDLLSAIYGKMEDSYSRCIDETYNSLKQLGMVKE